MMRIISKNQERMDYLKKLEEHTATRDQVLSPMKIFNPYFLTDN